MIISPPPKIQSKSFRTSLPLISEDWVLSSPSTQASDAVPPSKPTRMNCTKQRTSCGPRLLPSVASPPQPMSTSDSHLSVIDILDQQTSDSFESCGGTTAPLDAACIEKCAKTTTRPVEKMESVDSYAFSCMKVSQPDSSGAKECSTSVPSANGASSSSRCRTTMLTSSSGAKRPDKTQPTYPSRKSPRRSPSIESPRRSPSSPNSSRSPPRGKNSPKKAKLDQLTSQPSEDDWEVDYEDTFLANCSGVVEDHLRSVAGLPMRVVNLESERPLVQIGQMTFTGHYQAVEGTHLFFQPNPHEQPNAPSYELAGKSRKYLHLDRVCELPKNDL